MSVNGIQQWLPRSRLWKLIALKSIKFWNQILHLQYHIISYLQLLPQLLSHLSLAKDVKICIFKAQLLCALRMVHVSSAKLCSITLIVSNQLNQGSNWSHAGKDLLKYDKIATNYWILDCDLICFNPFWEPLFRICLH